MQEDDALRKHVCWQGEIWHAEPPQDGPPIITALREPMEKLSATFGPGLLGVATGTLIWAMMCFTLAINAEWCDGHDATLGLPPGT